MRYTKRFLALLLCPVLATTVVASANDEPAAAPLVVWKDAETGDVLFDSTEVEAFDWDDQLILLKPDALSRFYDWAAAKPIRELLVEDEEVPIYQARTVQPTISRAFDGPVYGSFNPLEKSPLLIVRNGYPGLMNAKLREDDDPRNASRLKTNLEQAGKLREIETSQIVVTEKATE